MFGWCLTGDCDTEEQRGGCPVAYDSKKPLVCSCECHRNRQPRGFTTDTRPKVRHIPEESSTMVVESQTELEPAKISVRSRKEEQLAKALAEMEALGAELA